MIRDGVSECDLAVGGDITGSAHDLHVADEAAPDIAVAAVVDIGGMDKEPTCVEGVVLFFASASLRSFEMTVERSPRAAEAIEIDNAFDEETILLFQQMIRWFTLRKP